MTNELDPVVQRCASQHFGPWLIEPQWFAEAVGHVKAGTFAAVQQAEPEQQARELYSIDGNGIARISIDGQMTKGESSYGGASTVRTRQAIRQAVNDDDARAILLHIDSPGGTVAGTAELAADVRAAGESKPVYTHFDDLGCSAAYWVGSQAGQVAAGATTLVGSIGTVAVVADTSGMMDKDGIKVHVVSTGEHKGAFVDGAPVTDEQLAELQTEVNDLNEHFLQGVADGRGITMESVRALADGRVHIAAKAMDLGLIDNVQSLDQTVSDITQEIHKMDNPIETFKADHPDAAKDLQNQGHVEGHADAKADDAGRLTALREKFGDRPEFVLDQFAQGHDVGKAQAAYNTIVADDLAKREAAVKLAEEKAASGTGGVDFNVAADVPAEPAKAPTDPKEKAEWEFDNSTEEFKAGFTSRENYVAVRVSELSGLLRIKTS